MILKKIFGESSKDVQKETRDLFKQFIDNASSKTTNEDTVATEMNTKATYENVVARKQKTSAMAYEAKMSELNANKTMALSGAQKIETAESAAATAVNKLKINSEAEELMIKAGLISAEEMETAATVQASLADIQLAINSKAVTLAEGQQIAATLGLDAAQLKAAGSAALLEKALDAIEAHPIIAALAAIVAVGTIAYNVYDYFTVNAEEAAEAMDNVKQEIEESNRRFKEVSSTISENTERFVELSKGVNEFSENLHLSEDDYKEYLSISQKIADIAPQLVYAYDEQGNALLNIGKNAKETNEVLQSVLETEKELNQQKLINGMDEVAQGIHHNVQSARIEISLLEDEKKVIESNYLEHNRDLTDYNGETGIISSDKNDGSVYEDYMLEAYKKAGIEIKEEEGSYYTVYKLEGYNKQKLALAQEYYDAMLEEENDYNKAAISKLDEKIKAEKRKIKQYYKDILPNIEAWLKNDSVDYAQISDKTGISGYVDQIVKNADWYEIEKTTAYKFDDEDDYKNYIKNEILEPLTSLPEEKREVVNEMLTQLLSFEEGDLGVLDFATRLQEKLKEYGITIDLTPIIGNEQEAKTNLQNSIESITKDDSGYGMLTSSGAKVDASEYYKLQDYTKDFTASQIELWNEVTLGATSATDAISRYEKELRKAKEEDLLGISETVDHLNTKVKPVLDSLASAYQDIFTDDGFTLDNVGVDMLNSVKEAIAEINEISGIDIDDSAFEDFTRVLSTTEITMDGVKTKEEEVHKAFNNLVTDIINGTDSTLVSSDAFNTLVQSLKEMGVTNANEALTEIKKTQDYLIKQGYDIDNMTEEEVEAFLKEAEALGISTQWFKQYTLQKAISENPLSTTSDIEALESLCNVLGVTGEMLEYVNRLKYANQMIDLRNKTGMGAPVEAYMAMANDAKAGIQKLLDEGSVFEFDFEFEYDGNKAGGKDKGSKEDFNWIETLISRIERNITNLGKTISATYKTWSERNKAIKDEYSELNKELQKQADAEAYYRKKASEVKLSESYKTKVRDGEISIESISNEDLKEAIQKYQELWEAALAAEDAQEDIRASMVDNFQTAFDLIQSEYDAKISEIESRGSIIDAMIGQQEAKGHLVSKSYYEDLVKLSEDEIALLTEEYNRLNNALNSSDITEGTEMWYELKGEIYGVEEALIGARTELIEYYNEMRNLDWEIFDKQQEAISRITEETEFLIDLMSNEELFNSDTGELTEYGTATMGLHAVNYNTYLEQAQMYAKELADIEKELSQESNDQDLIERREELLGLQRDMILAAQDELQTIKDLKSEYYDNLLNALQELIDKRKEALQAEKDLYDYQKSIAEKTKNINSIQKQLMAYEGDDSEEAQTKIQQLKVSLEEAQQDLEETEYDKWLSDQNQMMDKLASDAQDWVDERLKNLEAIISETIGITNEHSGAIRETLYKIANEYGYDMTDEMKAIWDSDGDIVSAFDKGEFVSTEVSILEVLRNIATDITKMVENSDKEVSSNGSNGSNNSGSSNKPTTNTGGSNTSTGSSAINAAQAAANAVKNVASSTNSTSSKNSSDVFISKPFKYSKEDLDRKGSIVDALKYYDYDDQFSARAKYYKALIGNDTYTGSAKQNSALLKKFREIKGYHEGGIVGELKNIIGNNGDNSLAINTFEKGEGIIPLSLMGDWKTLIANLEPLNMSMDFLNKALIPNIKANSGANGNVNNDVTLNVTLPNVKNYTEFRNELIKDKTFEKAFMSMNASSMLGKNSLNKFRH